MYPVAVIFDFDGVIVDTEPIHYQVFQKILTPMNMGYTWEEYLERYIGFDDRDAFKAVFSASGRTLEEKRLHDLIEQKAEMFEQVIALGVSPYPGVLDLVNFLTSLKIPLAISSGALRSDIMPILKQLNIVDNFKFIVTADDVSKSKPDPESYLKAKHYLMGCALPSPENLNLIYAIEDTPAGIHSAKGAGLRVIAVTNSYPAAMLETADVIVTDLTQLIDDNWG